MADDIEKVYRFAPLAQYTFKQRLLISLADRAFYFLIALVGASVRWETEGHANLEEIEKAGKLPIYVVWHDRIYLGVAYLKDRGIVFMASQSLDGEYIARFLQRFGFGVIRGSSTRGGARGLVEMIRGMKNGLAMGFTVDGPKGPRYEVKPGAAILAKKTGNPILPFLVQPQKFWRLNTWDKLIIPRPFTRALMIFGKPVYVIGDETAEASQAVQNELDDLVRRGEEWAKER